MKQPLYALLITPNHRMRTNIIYREKTITIREGHRDYRPGPVMICCHLVPWAVMADITNVRHCTLCEITQEEYEADGFNSQDDMLQGMQRFYPNMTLDSPVTIIIWEQVRGFLADHNVEYRLKPEKLYGNIKHRD